MNLRQIFAKLDSLEEEHGHGRFRVNLDWSVVHKKDPVMEWWDYGTRIDEAEGLEDEDQEAEED